MAYRLANLRIYQANLSFETMKAKSYQMVMILSTCNQQTKLHEEVCSG